MRLSETADPQSWLAAAFENPDRTLHPLLGSPGYRLPDRSGLAWIRASDCTIPGIDIAGAGPASDNWLLIDPSFRPIGKLMLRFGAGTRNNVIVVGTATQTVGDYLIHTSGNLIILCENRLQYSPLYLQTYSNDTLLYWGRNSTTNGLHIQLLGDGRRCVVGEDCMFSSGIYIRNSDIHCLVDMKTGEQRNPPTDVLVEPHVWVGQDAYLGRKTRIGFGSTIGAKSVVTKPVPRWVVVAGVPATIVSRETTWDRLPTPQPTTLADLRALEASLI